MATLPPHPSTDFNPPELQVPATPAGPIVAEGSHRAWVLSDDHRRIDFARVTEWLQGSYWCPGIPRAAVEQAARHSSLVVGAYDSPSGQQVGFLRVVSDCTRFAYLMDVYVASELRGCGLGRAMVRFALNHPPHRDVARWMLGTRDAHGVYAREGFEPLAEPDRLMQRNRPAPWEPAGSR
jgi:ribosomal protein S18 acetylase RimI-like enzyme